MDDAPTPFILLSNGSLLPDIHISHSMRYSVRIRSPKLLILSTFEKDTLAASANLLLQMVLFERVKITVN